MKVSRTEFHYAIYRAGVFCRPDQLEQMDALRRKKLLSPLFQLMLDVLVDGQENWTERFKDRVIDATKR